MLQTAGQDANELIPKSAKKKKMGGASLSLSFSLSPKVLQKDDKEEKKG